ncbi:MAG: hypothetical protein FWD57_13385 [Polyangiaceae bacterium]|nr:hypothetical protein [Polyangiaceae bacterium]
MGTAATSMQAEARLVVPMLVVAISVDLVDGNQVGRGGKGWVVLVALKSAELVEITLAVLVGRALPIWAGREARVWVGLAESILGVLAVVISVVLEGMGAEVDLTSVAPAGFMLAVLVETRGALAQPAELVAY